MHVQRGILTAEISATGIKPGSPLGAAMNSQDTARNPGSERRARIGMAEVVLAYGLESVLRRIEQLRITGMHYAATAIEHELGGRGACSHPPEPGQPAGHVDGLRGDGQPHPKLGLGERFCHPAVGETRTQLVGGQ